MGNDRAPPGSTFAQPLWRAAFTDARAALTLDAPDKIAKLSKPGDAVTFAPPDPRTVETARAQLLGPTYALLSQPAGLDATGASLLDAEAAMGVLPAMLLASVARPATDTVYRWIDHIPAALRRPFEKAFGLALDAGVALATGAAQSLLDASVRSFAPGAVRPAKVALPVEALSQLDTSCGETAVAMILKGAGEPVLLGEIDTQLGGPAGVPGTSLGRSAAGNTLTVDREFARRGLTAISGPSDLERLKDFVASGLPVVVAVGWANGGGHFAVVSGYDEARGTISLENWRADGRREDVPVRDFSVAWGRRMNLLTAVCPRRDARLDAWVKKGELRRPDTVAKGLSLCDFWFDATRLYVELAYRYVGEGTDATVRVSFNSEGLDGHGADAMRWLNGSIAVRREVARGWFVGFRVEKLSLRKQADEWTTLRTTPLGAALTVAGPGFELSVAGERGGVQAALGVALAKRLADLGLTVNVSLRDDGHYALQASLAGAW